MFLLILYQFLIDMCEFRIHEPSVYLGGNSLNIPPKFCLTVGAHLFSDFGLKLKFLIWMAYYFSFSVITIIVLCYVFKSPSEVKVIAPLMVEYVENITNLVVEDGAST